MALGECVGHGQESVDPLDLGHPSDHRDHLGVLRNAQPLPRRPADLGTLVVAFREGREVEAEPHHLHLRGRRDAEPDQILPHLLGHGDDAGGAASQEAFDACQQARGPRRELALEDVAVERVDDDLGPDPGSQPRGEPAERSGFRRVRVHDPRPDAPHPAHQLPQRSEIMQAKLAPETGHGHRTDAGGLCEVIHAALTIGQRPRKRVVSYPWRRSRSVRLIAWIAGPPTLSRAMIRSNGRGRESVAIGREG